MLKIENLTVRYGEKVAVNNLSLHISKGEIYGFIGHNGAGKTTTIKAATGILSFNEGNIIIDGVSIKDDPVTCKKSLAYIPDNPDLYEFMTGIQYLDFIADIFGISSETRVVRGYFRTQKRPRLGNFFLVARNEAETRHYFRAYSQSETHNYGRTVRRTRPKSLAPFKTDYARTLR